MDHNVPPYLIAIAVGDVRFKPIDARTGVYAEPRMLSRDAAELSDTDRMVTTAEALYGRYSWGRYDVLVLPPSFPFGGMENPTLTFATPTIITGDKSNIDVIAHELAHSWSGNLVTNATWSDSWLNEGFTTYFENRIDEALYGKERAATLADLLWDNLQRDLKEAPDPDATRLHGKPEGVYGELDYTKGSTFLRTIEYAVGRPRWDAYLKSYFDRHAFQPQTSAGFLTDLRTHLVRGDATLEKRLELDAWVYGPGLPANAVHVRSATLARIDATLARVTAGASIASIDTSRWSTQEWLRFLNGLPRTQTKARLAELDRTLRLSTSANAYVRSAWLVLAIGNRYDPAIPSIAEFLPSVGRGLLILPVYRTLIAQDEWGVPIAKRDYALARPAYHPTIVKVVDQMLKIGIGVDDVIRHPGPPLCPTYRRRRDSARCLSWCAEGLDDAAIATRTGLTVNTVRNHVCRLYRKIGVNGRSAGRDLGARTRDWQLSQLIGRCAVFFARVMLPDLS